MARRAFTLIELMIVVAIMGIMFASVYDPGWILRRLQDRAQIVLNHNRNLTDAYLKLKKFNSERSEIQSVTPQRVVFKDGASLILDTDKNHIILSSGAEKTIISDLPFSAPIEQFNAKTYAFELIINGEKLNSYWRCSR